MPFNFSSPNGAAFVSNQGISALVGASNTAKWVAFGAGAGITLTPGVWRCSAWWIFTASNTVGYAQNSIGWFGAAGTGTTVAPANIPSVAGFSVCAGFGASGFNTSIVPAVQGDNASGAAPTIRVYTDRVQPVFFGMKPQGTTLGAAYVSCWTYGERVE